MSLFPFIEEAQNHGLDGSKSSFYIFYIFWCKGC